jgi:mannitol 2-dehydrogenase
MEQSSIRSADPIRLAAAQLDSIRALGTAFVPSYDRSGLTAGIVHFGVGGFHRAHQAMVIDELLQSGQAREYAICGVGVMEQDRSMKNALDSQDGLYVLMIKHADGRREARVIGSIIKYLLAPDDPEAVLETLASPDTRIVSLTITEGGYNFDQITGEFQAESPAVVADLRGESQPQTVFGLIVEGLRRRRQRGIPPFTVQSCDNIQGNGDVAKRMFTTFAGLLDEEFATWMEETVAFPNSMVDRITPVTSDADRSEVRFQLGIDDRWPVVSEPFFQWVIEDEFPLGRPPYGAAGAQMVRDVEPYELMKLRLLNASHQALCYFGYLAGYRFAHEAMADPSIAQFVRAYMDNEGSPTLEPVPGVDLESYKSTLIERFSNPEVRDTLARLCAESSDRIPKWLVPVVNANLAAGRDIRISAAIIASWARYAEGVDESGEAINVVDRLAGELVPLARSQRDHPLAFVENKALFGDLASNSRFREEYLKALRSLYSEGARATVARWGAL